MIANEKKTKFIQKSGIFNDCKRKKKKCIQKVGYLMIANEKKKYIQKSGKFDVCKRKKKYIQKSGKFDVCKRKK